MLVIESWVVRDSPDVTVSSEAVLEVLRVRIDGGLFETWFAGSTGRLLGFVTNTQRAMVMLLDGEDDPGEHAVEPGAPGSREGFVLSNGQHDVYQNEDTVPIGEAFTIVGHIIRRGSWPTDTRWVADR
ncbi:hypothetical protein AB0Q95_11695 [Streptomyces sp. NPDC059900]|uniref:hypothetical protein n=1 Tax=Streptomyces sp. NPDC059900 TaxID=3155816 RepID=UPI003435CF4B